MNLLGIFYFFGICIFPVIIISLINILFCIYFDYFVNIDSYIYVFIISLLVFFITKKIEVKKKDINKFEILLFSLSIYFFIPFILSLPFYLGGYLSLPFSYFESMSGFTSVGVTLIQNVYFLDEPILLWRSIIQWLGGFYFLLFVISIFGQEIFEFLPLKFLQKEKDTNYFHLNFSKNINFIIYAYLILSLIIIFLLNFTDLRLFEKINLMFSIVSGGAFLSNNINFDSNFEKIILSVCFIFSSINIFFLLIITKINRQYSLDETKMILIIICLILFIISLLNRNLDFADIFLSVTSSSSNSGINFTNTTNINIFFLLLTVFIGGSIVSNSGGFKLARLHIIFKNILNEFGKLIIPSSISNFSIFNSTEKIKNKDFFITCFILFTYLLVILIYSFFLSFENLSFDSVFKISFLLTFNTYPGSLYGLNDINFTNFNQITLIVSIFIFILSKITPLSFILLFKNLLLR